MNISMADEDSAEIEISCLGLYCTYTAHCSLN